MARGLREPREEAHGAFNIHGPVSPFARAKAAASPLHGGSRDGFPLGGSWAEAFRASGSLAKSVVSCNSSAHGGINRSDSAWAAPEEAPEAPPRAALPVFPSKQGSLRTGKSNGSVTVVGPEETLGTTSICNSWREKHGFPFSWPFRKIPSNKKTSSGLLSGLSSASGNQGDSPYGFCLLTFRNAEMEEQYRASRLVRRTSSSVGISVLFLLVLSSLCPIYGKVLCMLGVSEKICFSFTVGCGALIGAWVLHACIVAFRKKMGISDKITIQFTLFLIGITLLLALGWANVYLCFYAENHNQYLKDVSEAVNISGQEAGSLFLPSEEGASPRRLSQSSTPLDTEALLASPSDASPTPLDKALAAAAAAASPVTGGALGRQQAAAEETASGGPPGALGGCSQSDMDAINLAINKARDLLHVKTFILFLILTLSIVAVYSLTDFAPAFLAWSWPFYLISPVLTVTTSVVSNVLLHHNFSAESTYMAFLLSAVVWGCGFANRYVCEAESRAEFSFTEGATKRMQEQATKGTENNGTASATAVEQLQQLAGTALQLVKAARIAVAEGAAPFASEHLFLQLQTTIAELSATLAETDDLYSCRIMHSLMDTAAGQRWLSAMRLRGSAMRDDYGGSADASMLGGTLSLQGHQMGYGSSEVIHSSCLLEDGPWLRRCVMTPGPSSARCSGSDWHRPPSEGVALEPITRADSPTFLTAAFAGGAAGVAGGGGRFCMAGSNEESKQLNKAPSLTTRNLSLPEACSEGRGELETSAAAGIQTANAPPSQVLTSLARSFFTLRRYQTRARSVGAHHDNGGGQAGGLVEDMLEVQMRALRNQDWGSTRYREIPGDLVGRPAPFDAVEKDKHRSFTSPPAFAGIGAIWDIDVLSLAQSHQGILQHVGWALLRPYVNLLGCGDATILRLLQQVEARYDPELPYHTATHAAQVAHAAMVLNSELGLDPGKDKVGSFCLALAALAHDVGHLGKTNGFFQQSRHILATIYNDQSIMENFHSSILFRIINEIPSANVFRSQSAEAYQSLRQQIITLILATDMKDHVDIISRCRIKRNCPDFNFVRREEDALYVRKMLLKMADISHSLLCWRDHFIWTCKISEEFYRQGDAERRLKLPISPVCNRESHQFLAQNQVAFLKILVEPLLCEIEGLEQAAENQSPTMAFIRGTLRKRYENNVERWTILDNSGMFIIFDSETLSRGFYRPSNRLECQNAEGDLDSGAHQF